MDAVLMMNAIMTNPLGMTSREIAEWYWQGVRVRDTRRDNMNLSMYN